LPRDASNVQYQRDLWVGYGKVGDLYERQGWLSEALAAYWESLNIARVVARRDPSTLLDQRRLAATYSNIGRVYARQGDLTNALVAYQDNLMVTEDIDTLVPANDEIKHDLVSSHIRIGDIQWRQGRRSEALKAYRQAQKIAEGIAARTPSNAAAQRSVMISLWNQAEITASDDGWQRVLDKLLEMKSRSTLAEKDQGLIEEVRAKLAALAADRSGH
jgi:tetratricopeptide (TPR) repeat protein